MKTGATVITVATAMVVLVGAGTGVGYYAWQHHQEVLNMEAAQARQDYRNNLLLTAADLTKDAEDANSVTDEISQIWHDAIFNDFGVDVHGTYASTFDDALQDESQYLESQGTLDRLTSEDTQIQDQISKLNSPPVGFEKAYSELETVYQAYSDMLDEAESPSGTLVEYNNRVNDDQSKFLSNIKMVSLDAPSN